MKSAQLFWRIVKGGGVSKSHSEGGADVWVVFEWGGRGGGGGCAVAVALKRVQMWEEFALK